MKSARRRARLILAIQDVKRRPFYGPLMLLCGLAGGVFGLIAMIRQKEPAAPVWLAKLVGLFVLLIVLNEFIQLAMYLQGTWQRFNELELQDENYFKSLF